MATLKLLNLSKRFGTVVAVDHLNLEVTDSEFMCILGPSGCGKSTALRMIAGFETPSAGDVQIDAVSVVEIPPNRRPTAMVFQKYTLWPHMKVYENIAFGLQLRRLSRPEIEHKVQEVLDLVGLSEYGSRFPAQLSGGEQQRIALARAIVLEPKILLLDEPFSNLDALLRVRLREELRRIQRRLKITAIFVTHDQEEALSLADRIALMNAGRIEQVDAPSVIYAHPSSLFAADFIGAMNLFKALSDGKRLVIGAQSLATPDGIASDAKITVGVRPEDFAILPATAAVDAADTWRGHVDQIMDMGHFRKLLISIAELDEPIKVYASKSVSISEGTNITLYPLRYLIYQGDKAPIEVQRQLSDEALADTQARKF